MAITLTGTGGLFTRWGREIFALNSLNVYLGDSTISSAINAIGKSVADINAQYLAADQDVISDLYAQRDTMRTSQITWEQYLQQLAQNTLVEQANDSAPLPSKDMPTARDVLVAQMTSTTATVQRPVTSASAPVAGRADSSSNVGTGVLAVSVKHPTGRTQDYIFAETLTVTCTSDAQSGATERQEGFTLTTPVAAADVMGFNFPLGSGVSVALNVVDPTLNNSGGNLLTDSDFEQDDNVTNVPDQWNAVGATPGTDLTVNAGSGGVFGEGYLQFTANSGSTPAITQEFGNSTGGTAASLEPDTQYAVSFWCEKSTGLAGAGVLSINLVDDTNTIINDDAGTANTISQTLASASSTTFTNKTGFFRTPAVLPDTVKIRVWTSTAIADAAAYVRVGGLAMTPATKIYNSGPYVSMFAGATQFYVNDRFTCAINNDYSGKFQVGLDKFLNLREDEVQIPSAVSPSISDTLVS